MKIYVISLVNAYERRKAIENQFKKLNIEFEFFSAILGNEKMRDNSIYDFIYRDKVYGRQMTLGELGVFHSHRILWSKISSQSQPACILEDDVILNENFIETLKVISNYNDYDLIELGGLFERKSFLYKKFKNVTFIKFWRDPLSAIGYVIKPESAKELLNRSKVINIPVDDFIGNYALHKLNVLGCLPHVIKHDTNIPSQILNRQNKRNLSVTEKFYRESIILAQIIRGVVFQLKYWIILLCRLKNYK